MMLGVTGAGVAAMEHESSQSGIDPDVKLKPQQKQGSDAGWDERRCWKWYLVKPYYISPTWKNPEFQQGIPFSKLKLFGVASPAPLSMQTCEWGVLPKKLLAIMWFDKIHTNQKPISESILWCRINGCFRLCSHGAAVFSICSPDEFYTYLGPGQPSNLNLRVWWLHSGPPNLESALLLATHCASRWPEAIPQFFRRASLTVDANPSANSI